MPGFDTYQSILNGQPPIETYQRAMPLSHIQAWRIQEHIRVAKPPSSSSRRRSAEPDNEGGWALPIAPGPALKAHLPERFDHRRVKDGIEVTDDDGRSVFYRCVQSNLHSKSALEGV